MMKRTALILLLCLASVGTLAAQRANSNAAGRVSLNDLVRISKAEDSLNYAPLAELLKSSNAAVRARAALAAGRIGDERAIDALIALLTDAEEDVLLHAMFAIGEIESLKAADTLLNFMKAETRPVGSVPALMARLVEAAGKIAAANAADPKAKLLGVAILETLEREHAKTADQNHETIRFGLIAALRARPDKADATLAKFLTHTDARIRADAANALSRLRAKNANATLRQMLKSDPDPVARANAARALGAAEDKDARDLVLNAAITDSDSRVRVSAIRSLVALKDSSVVERLLAHGEKLGSDRGPADHRGEMLEIASVLGRLLAESASSRAKKYVNGVGGFPNITPETEVAWARIDPVEYSTSGFYNPAIKALIESSGFFRGRDLSAIVQGLSELTNSKNAEVRANAVKFIEYILDRLENEPRLRGRFTPEAEKAVPDVLRAIVAAKLPSSRTVLQKYAKHEDVFIRSPAIGLLVDLPADVETTRLIREVFPTAIAGDKRYNDAQLSILDALFKLDKKGSVDMFTLALGAPDYLVRKKAFELLNGSELKTDPGAGAEVALAVAAGKNRVLPYNPRTGTKLGQVLNTDPDYRRALSRKNGTIKAVLTTEKGVFTIEFYPEQAPLTVDNFVRLARSGYFNGLEVHRVVPNFVMQDGDPRGDGNGGPGWSIRCEVNMREYGRGAVGMALSGKDTGGSQWFVTHAPQPHLDGGYTVFGQVSGRGMKVVDNIVRGDKILSVRIFETVRFAVPRKRK